MRGGSHMSKIFTILTLLWLLSIGGTTNATDWYYVGPDASGNQLFIDNDSVQKSDYDALFVAASLMNWVATNCDIKFISVDIIEPWKH